jgi:1,6-anhydro-N-acetylmuramate kinase
LAAGGPANRFSQLAHLARIAQVVRECPMLEVSLLNRLRAVCERRRWVIGLRVAAGCRALRAVVVGVEGRGLTARAEVFASAWASAPPAIRSSFARLRTPNRSQPGEAPLLAALLAESQAALLDTFAAQIAPVWDRVMAVAIDDPGVWAQGAGLSVCGGLCDAARLADLSGLNVIDGFSGRDLAQDGRGRPLLPVPYWILLRDLRRTRLLVEWGSSVRMTLLPASRDDSGASGLRSFVIRRSKDSGPQSAPDTEALVQQIVAQMPSLPGVVEVVLCCRAIASSVVRTEFASQLPALRVLEASEIGIPAGCLQTTGVALLGLLHLDQTPANVPTITGARTPRVLGSLTPGSLANWHRLVRELAAAKPTVVSLRSAI